MLDMGTFDYHSYDLMSLDQLAHIRNDGMKRVDQVTEVIKQKVIEERDNGTPITKIAKTAGVTRPTVYSWISE